MSVMNRLIVILSVILAIVHEGVCVTEPSFSLIPPSVQCSPQGFVPKFVYDTGAITPSQNLSISLFLGDDESNNLCSGVVNATSGNVTLAMDVLDESYVTRGYIGFTMSDGSGGRVPRCGGVLEHWTDNGTERIRYQVNAKAIVTRTYRNKIERKTKYPFVIQCGLERKVGVSTNNSFVMSEEFVDATDAASVNNTITFAATLRFYDTADYSRSLTNLVLRPKNDERLYIQVEQGANQDLFKFVVRQCYATVGADSNAAASKTDIFFNNQCPVDNDVNFAVSDGKFQIDTLPFAFIGSDDDEEIWFHCNMYVCLASNTDDVCTQKPREECSGVNRRRRAVDGVLGVQTTSSSQPVVLDRTQVHVPWCGTGFVYDRILEECSNQHLLEIRGVHLSEEEYFPAYADTKSPAFRQLAKQIEQLLWIVLRITDFHKIINGVQVVRASEGSVVLDIVIKYSDSVSELEAFKTFKEVLATPPTVTRVMNFLKLQYVDRIKYESPAVTPEKADTDKLVIVVVVVCVLVVVFIAGVTFFKVKHARRVTPMS